MKNNSSSSRKRHELKLKNRKKLQISGVKEVISYNEKNILLETTGGTLNIKGENLDLKQLDLEKNQVKIRGQIKNLNYSNQGNKQGFWEKLFK